MEYEKRKNGRYDENGIKLIDSIGLAIAKILNDMESVKKDIQEIKAFLWRWTN